VWKAILSLPPTHPSAQDVQSLLLSDCLEVRERETERGREGEEERERKRGRESDRERERVMLFVVCV
jgi:hypothetical protein